ncbi:MAG: ABC transporter ATP-binding protein [Bacteroidota bacterium]|jgi:ABC-2 type transport system ATP-binding protein|nr:ABC transporter ATP-binding protein [Bacteroidota bacterium]
MSIIHADRVTKVFNPRGKGAVTALAELSLEVREGEIFGLLGPNGAGKTTFIKVLLEIVRVTAGRAVMLGEPVGNAAAKARVGYLPENHRYPDFLTGAQVLRYFGKLSGVPGPELEQRIDDRLRLVGMEQWKNTKIRKYSKGMLQRIGLAQALINDPKLVMLDEPTDGVDPIGRKEIRDLLARLRDAGKTVFLNSHLLSEVELICDRVAILNKGRLIRLGTVKELTTSENTYRIAIAGALPDSLRAQWEATRLSMREEHGELVFSLPDTAALNAVIDQLRGAGVLLTGVTEKRQSLEDLFIDTIAREEAQ